MASVWDIFHFRCLYHMQVEIIPHQGNLELLDIAIIEVTIEEIKEMHEIAKIVYSENGEQRLVLRSTSSIIRGGPSERH